MKKITIILIFIFVGQLFTQDDAFNLAIRNIKLGNSYREAKNYDFAARFINDGMAIVEKRKNFDGKYWTATGYEYLGYLYRDMGMAKEAKKNFERAADKFKEIIKQDDGSQYAMIEVLNGLSRSFENNKSISQTGSNSLSLNYSQSKLKELPSGIPDNIQSFILRNNKFTTFPDGLSRLPKLEYLDLSGNRIKSVPESINNLTKLHYLDLSNNRISTLPAVFSGLGELKELNLSGNKLKSLSPAICTLQNLKFLNLKGNKLKFEDVLNIVKCLQNTNIIFDEYQRLDEDQDEEIITGETEN